MFRFLIAVLVAGWMWLIVGCGGYSQDDMRKYAIRRPGDDQDTNQTAASKPPTQSPDPTGAPSSDAASPGDSQPNPNGSGTENSAASNAAPASVRPDTGQQTPPAEDTSPAASNTTGAQLSDTKPPDTHLSLPDRRAMTIENMRRIVKAIEAYRDDNGAYPPRAIFSKSGYPLLSWRVLLLPYLGYDKLFAQFRQDEPWDSLNNQRLLKLIPSVFQSPERFDSNTNYLVPVGTTSAFSGDKGQHPRRWEDGIRNIVLLLEVDESHAVPWTAPKDLEVDLRKPKKAVGGLRADGFFVGWGGGSVGRIPNDVNPRRLKAMYTVDGGERFSSAAISKLPTPEPQVETSESPVASATSGAADGSASVAAAASRSTPSTSSGNQSRYAQPPAARSHTAANNRSDDSLATKARRAAEAGLHSEAYHFALAAYLTDEMNLPYQWVSGLRRPAPAVRFGAGVDYAGTRADSVKKQLSQENKDTDASSKVPSVVGELADPMFAQLATIDPFLPEPLVSFETQRRGQQTAPFVQLLGMGSRGTIVRAALQSHVDVLLWFEVSELPTRSGKKTKRAKLTVIDTWRNEDLLVSPDVSYTLHEREKSDPLYDDPIKKTARRLGQLLRDELVPQSIPVQLRASHARRRVAHLARRKMPDPLLQLAEVKFYRSRDLVSVQQEMKAYQEILDSPATGTELLAGKPDEKRAAIEPWLPVVSLDLSTTARQNQRPGFVDRD